MIYDNLEKKAQFLNKIPFYLDFNNGCKLSIDKCDCEDFDIRFYDHNTNNLIYKTTLKGGMWSKPSLEYFIKWRIEIRQNNEVVFTHLFDCKNKKVYIKFESKAIGDTIAWFPYIEEFRKTHQCYVICSTFHNEWFQPQYPEIEFVNPGTQVENVYASYKIGWFYKENTIDYNKHKTNPLHIPLQQTATDILGLEYTEIKPFISHSKFCPLQEKYVTLSIQSTCQAKYWNHPTGWQQVIDFFNSQGYKVILVDKFKIFGKENFMNKAPERVLDYTNKPLNEIIPLINHAKFHLGLSSGLSWLAWALNTPVVMISSFTKPYCEFQSDIVRIYNDTPTSGYFNTHKLDPSNWNWYPFKEIKSMEDWYEIETITPEQVINEIKQIL